MEVSAHELVRTRVCRSWSCVGEVVNLELGLCSDCERRRLDESEMTFEVLRDRRRCWVRALHLPTGQRTAWREVTVWAGTIRAELVAELRGLVQGSA